MRWLVVLVLAAIAVGGLILWNPFQPPAPAPAPLNEAPVRRVTAEGSIVPLRHTNLSFKIGGRLTQLPVEVGDRVQPGEPLALLDDSELRLQVATP